MREIIKIYRFGQDFNDVIILYKILILHKILIDKTNKMKHLV